MATTITVYKDLNVRLPQVDSTDTTVVTDSKAVIQSIWRLFTTVEGEIPFYRGYGLNLNQFVQRPLNRATANDIDEYVKNKIKIYEPRVEVIRADATADLDNGIVALTYTVKVKATSQLITLQALKVTVNG